MLTSELRAEDTEECPINPVSQCLRGENFNCLTKGNAMAMHHIKRFWVVCRFNPSEPHDHVEICDKGRRHCTQEAAEEAAEEAAKKYPQNTYAIMTSEAYVEVAEVVW